MNRAEIKSGVHIVLSGVIRTLFIYERERYFIRLISMYKAKKKAQASCVLEGKKEYNVDAQLLYL